MNSRLYLGNLAPSVTESELRLLFSRAGAITKIEFMFDTATRQPRGFAFITMFGLKDFGEFRRRLG